MANLFVSHRGTDAAEAERLARELAAQGHEVWLDSWDIGIGDSIVARIDEGLTGGSYLILCYSESGVLSPWMGREWMSALARQLDGKGVKVLPVRLTGGDPPGILADVRYADLVRDWDQGMAELLRAIR
jgi:hypothetical protein